IQKIEGCPPLSNVAQELLQNISIKSSACSPVAIAAITAFEIAEISYIQHALNGIQRKLFFASRPNQFPALGKRHLPILVV
ncbi:hypothetical protein, partial [uncultured Desulfovibrio sp.]|uniref:hypothetical protein n=1 Tax=uncultured Desulfovibrio sp. TaxID=167968 RepID=UPI00266F117B